MGVCNYNLIVLSSVIPGGAEIVEIDKYSTPVEEWGHKLYVVRADIRSDKEGEFIGAGLGWYQLPDGRGVFVEHEEIGASEKEVSEKLDKDIRNTLSDLCKFRGIEVQESEFKTKVQVSQVKGPTCALVLAVYKSEGWK
jgi:arginine decarboxylase